MEYYNTSEIWKGVSTQTDILIDKTFEEFIRNHNTLVH